jgi:hypothetical protein
MSLGYAPQLKANQLDAITTRAGNAAKLLIYSGSRPGAAGGSIGASVLLATIIMGTPFAPAAVQGTGGPLLPTLPAGITVGVSGLAAWARLTQSDGTTFVTDMSVSTIAAATGDLQISDTNLIATGTLTLTAATITHGN